MLNRRDLLESSGAAFVTAILSKMVKVVAPLPKGPFRFYLNTSTISGQKPGLLHSIEIA
ncbi:MAG: hypothetical protein ABI861_07385 [Panacibacter sp.]